jgi:hypothetical protein
MDALLLKPSVIRPRIAERLVAERRCGEIGHDFLASSKIQDAWVSNTHNGSVNPKVFQIKLVSVKPVFPMSALSLKARGNVFLGFLIKIPDDRG